MSDITQGRMLLAHNFDLSDDRLPALTREAFAQLFVTGFQGDAAITGAAIAHPHWMVELRFDQTAISAAVVGDRIAQLFHTQRHAQLATGATMPDLLILGGLKTTPATSPDAIALQPGQWGVDVVETASGEGFLAGIQWESAIAEKEPDTIFKVERRG